jgi:hypothetical protein
MIRNILLFAVGMVLIFAAGLRLPFLDDRADLYFNETISKAGVSYAACRLINGGVSVIKESNVSVEPMGVGVSLAIGQILDPIDDMTERLSDVLVTAMAALGTQKLFYEVAIYLTPIVLGVFLITWVAAGLFSLERSRSLRRMIFGLIVVMGVCRMCLPLSALINEGVYARIFEPKILAAKSELPFQNGEIDKLTRLTIPESDGVWDTTKQSFDLMATKSVQLKNTLVILYKGSVHIISNLVQLTFLYVGLFFIQVLFIPLSVFYCLAKLINHLFGSHVPPLLKFHPPKSTGGEQVARASEVEAT